MLEELAQEIRKGDFVILSTEYFLSLDGSPALKDLMLEGYPEAQKIMPQGIWDRSIYLAGKAFRDFNKKFRYMMLGELDTEHLYQRKNFNELGDFIGHLDAQKPTSVREMDKVFSYSYYKGIEHLNRFQAVAEERGVEVVYFFSPLPSTLYQNNANSLYRLQTDFQKYVKIPILNSLDDVVYPDSLFFDTANHLNKQGRKERTKHILTQLKKKDHGYFSITP